MPVALRPEARFDELVCGPNAAAIAAVRHAIASDGEIYLYLFGPAGSGKSHVLHAACHAVRAAGRTPFYLALSDPSLHPAVLDGLEHVSLVALDDVERVARHPDWERALFDLYNRLREAGRVLLVSGDRPARDLPFELEDLRSRLGWGASYRLRPLGDADCAVLLRQAAQRRGLALSEAAIAYILRRAQRDARGLLALLDVVDRESLREQRQPSLRLIRAVLGAFEEG